MEKTKPDPWSTAYQNDRVKLIDAVPLDAPLCIIIEPTNVCNFKCLMCWQSTEDYKKDGGPFSNMDMKLFEKIIDDTKSMVEKYGKIKLIKLYSTGEPLLHPQIGEMVKKIKEADICVNLEITTNGSLLTPELSRQLVEYGLDYLRVSIYAIDKDEEKRITQTNIAPDTIAENVKYLYEYRNKEQKEKPFICTKIMHVDENTDARFKAMFSDRSDEQLVDIPWNIPKLKEESLDKLDGSKENGELAQQSYLDSALYKQRKVCRYPFTHITIRNNGDAVVCCQDWARDTKMGNIQKKTLEQIWTSKTLYNFRVMQLKTKGINHPLCATCELTLRDSAEDNLDDLPIDRLSFKE